MSAPEKENLNGELENAEENMTAPEEVPSDAQLPEVPQETDEVSVPAADDKDEPKKHAAVIVSAEEVEKSKVAEKRRVAAEAEKKKKRNSLLLKICIPVVVVAFLALAFFESNLFYRVMPAVNVNGTSYSVTEFNYFYTNSFSQMYQNLQSTYGDYVSYFVDTSKALKDQPYSETETWEDAVKARALSTMENLTCLTKEGKAAGYELSEDGKASVDSAIESVGAYAAAYGYGTDDYLVAVYGKGMNKDTYRKLVEMTYYASEYSLTISNDPVPTQEEIDARYAENPNDFDVVSFRYFYVSASKASDEETDDATLAANAKKKADAMAAVKTEQEFLDLATENTAEDLRADYNADTSTMADSIAYSAINSGYSDWLYDTARKAGDTFVYEAKDDTEKVTGYYVIYFLSRGDINYNTVNVRHILVSPTKSEDGTVTDEAKLAAKNKADALLQQWATDGGTEDAFAALATANSGDSGSAAKGGLYENVYKGQMVAEFNDWCFDSARKPGDTGVVETSYGYHVMYFVGESESYLNISVRQKIGDDRYTAWQEANLPNYKATEEFGMKYGCNK